MPLLDHFHSPLSNRRPWESFHGSWAGDIIGLLNTGVLPEGFFAAMHSHVGSRVEVDVATFSEERQAAATESGGGVAVEPWAPPVARTIPAVFPDEVEVLVFRQLGGAVLAGAIELVSPGNLDRPEARRHFAAKCLSYLQTGVGLLVVDIVTESLSNLHEEVLALMGLEVEDAAVESAPLYAVSYRPFRTDRDGDRIDITPAVLQVGEALPTMPLALFGGPTVPIDLEASYLESCRRNAITVTP